MHRGGSWHYDGVSSACRASCRSWNVPGFRYGTLGFRLLRVISLPESGATSPQRSGGESPAPMGRPAPKSSAPATTPPAATPTPAASNPVGPAPPLAIAPFDAAKATEHQAAWAKYLGVSVETTNSIGMRFVLIPPGEFDMGSTEAEVAELVEEARRMNQSSWYIERLRGEAPRHRVRITQPFWLGRYEVTRGQFRRFVDERGYRTEAERDGKGGWGYIDGQWRQDPGFVWNADLGFEQADNYPVVQVTWWDIMAFCAWLSEKEGQASHLPTEAQWEYACRAGTDTTWNTGDDMGAFETYAWFNANAGGKPHPVGQKPPNAWGLSDTHGSVWESCQDWWSDRYYATSPVDDPPGAIGGSLRVARGGGWADVRANCRSSFRGWNEPGNRGEHLGFRLAKVAGPHAPSR